MSETVLSLDGISKSYGPVKVLQEVGFEVRRGTIHTLLGENGAGKSTTLKIIKGEVRPDSGTLTIDGRAVTEFVTANAERYGIAMVHQELAVFDNMTVAENIFVDRPPLTGGIIDSAAMHGKADELLALFGLAIDPRERMIDLTPGQRQIVEILRALAAERKVIILDEPTSGLNAHEAEILLGVLKQLRGRGQTIMFVSHRLSDVLAISDAITVLRDGKVVDTLANAGLTEADLVSRMVGREFGGLKARTGAAALDAPIVFEAEAFTRSGAFEDVSLEVRRGEIVGVYGLEGSGTSELSRALFGLDPIDSGRLRIGRKPVSDIDPLTMIARGVSFLNSDRKAAGLFMTRSVADNIAAPVLGRHSRFGLIKDRELIQSALAAIKRFAIRVSGVHASPASLSGGNQQKVMLSACLAPAPDIVIINEPTRGIDVGAKAEVYKTLNALADTGKSLLTFSSELPELLLIADRILVMRGRRIVGALTGADRTEERVMELAAGQA